MMQVCSALCEGVFEKFPHVKLVAVEGGYSWVPHLMWRLDKNWKGLRDTVPWLKKAPSEYLPDHARFTTQPMEEPPVKSDLLEVFRMMDAERTLMFSSDFPHWDAEDPRYALRSMPEQLKERILFRNAADTFRLPRELEVTEVTADA